MSNEMRVMANTKHIAREGGSDILDNVQHITDITHPSLSSQHIHQTLSDERKQLSNSFVSEDFLKSGEKSRQFSQL